MCSERFGATKATGIGAKGLGRIVAGAAGKVVGTLGKMVFGGPAGWALLAYDAYQLGSALVDSHQETDKVRAWARTVGMNEEEAIEAMESGTDEGFKKLQAANRKAMETVQAGGYMATGGVPAEGMEDFNKAYEALVTSGKLSNVLAEGGGSEKVMGNLTQILEGAGIRDRDTRLNIIGAIGAGAGRGGKVTELGQQIGARLTQSMSMADEFTVLGRKDLEATQTNLRNLFGSQWYGGIDDDGFESQAAQDIVGTGESATVDNQNALVSLLRDKNMRSQLRLATTREMLKAFKKTYPQFKSMDIALLERLRDDLESGMSLESDNMFGASEQDIEKHFMSMAGQVETLLSHSRGRQLEGQMATVRTVGSQIGEMEGGEALGGLLTSASVGNLRKAGGEALKLVRSMGAGKIGKIRDARTRGYLQSVLSADKLGKSLSGKDETQVREALRGIVPDKFLNEILSDEDTDMSDEELSRITSGLAGSQINKLLTRDGMSTDELRASGGKDGITADYIKAAKEAADAHKSFVRAVYSEPTVGKTIQQRAERK